MVDAAKQARVQVWETTLYKSLPLFLFSLIVFSTIPQVKFINPDLIPQIWTTALWSFIPIAYLIELNYAWSKKGERGHFGTPLIFIFMGIGIMMAANSWFHFYHFGDIGWVDSLIYFYMIVSVALLIWMARTEYFKHKKMVYSVYTKLGGS